MAIVASLERAKSPALRTQPESELKYVALVATAKLFVIQNSRGVLEPILPSPLDRLGIERCYVEFDAGGGQIDSNPMHQSASVLVAFRAFTAIGDTPVDFRGRDRMPKIPRPIGAEDRNKESKADE